MKTFFTIVLTIVVLGLLGLVYIYSGLFNVAADSRDIPVLDWVLNTTSERSIETRSDKLASLPIFAPSPLKRVSNSSGRCARNATGVRE